MNPIRPTQRLLSRPNPIHYRPHLRRQICCRRPYSSSQPTPPSPTQSTPPPPPPPSQPPSRVGAYYSTFGSPLLKCFLGALFTYQITYYCWLKLESIEATHEQKNEIRGLQEELRRAIEEKKGKVEKVVDEMVDEVKEVGKGGGVVGRVARGGWWPW